MRADRLIVERGLARSRTLARRLIEAGAVQAIDTDGRALKIKPASLLDAQVTLRINESEIGSYASRGGLKLAGALAHTDIHPDGWHCLDAGQSTGGFTDCLLQHGVARVCGIDVGHGQLAAQLRADPRVHVIEHFNLRRLDRQQMVALDSQFTADGFDLIVADLSFISLRLVLPALATVASPATQLLALVKPQFEAGRAALNERGIVSDQRDIDRVRESMPAMAQVAGWTVLDWFPSPIDGADGNREFFIHARPEPQAAPRETPQNGSSA